jgi:hypothetical protein
LWLEDRNNRIVKKEGYSKQVINPLKIAKGQGKARSRSIGFMG